MVVPSTKIGIIGGVAGVHWEMKSVMQAKYTHGIS